MSILSVYGYAKPGNYYDDFNDGSMGLHCAWPVRSGQGGAFGSLDISKSGNGTGTVTSDPAGINCGSDCSESYDAAHR